MLFACSKPRPSWTIWEVTLPYRQKAHGESEDEWLFLPLPQPQTQNFVHYSLFNFPGCRAFLSPSAKSPQLLQLGVQVHRVLWEWKPRSLTLGCSPHFGLLRQLAQCHSADTVLFIAWDSEWQPVKPKGCRASTGTFYLVTARQMAQATKGDPSISQMLTH